MNRFKKNKTWLLANLLVALPLVIVFVVTFFGNFKSDEHIADPSSPWARQIHLTGEWAIRWLVVSLSITPLSILFNWKQKTRYRKLFGLYAFVYTVLHVIFFLLGSGFWDIFIEINLVLALGSSLILLVLAVTSNKTSIKLLKKHWKSVHRWVYAAALMAVLHLMLIEKRSWLLYGIILLTGFIIRVPFVQLFFKNIRNNQKTLSVEN